jgi:hypothetical protein
LRGERALVERERVPLALRPVREVEAFFAEARRPAAAGRRAVALPPLLAARLRAGVAPRLAAVLRVRPVVPRAVFVAVFLLLRAAIESPPGMW